MPPRLSEIGRNSNAKLSALFLFVHVCGVWLAGRSLLRVWNSRWILEIYWGGFTWLACVCIFVVVMLGVAALIRTMVRWRQGKIEKDVGIRLRALLYVAIGCLLLHVMFLRVRSPVMADVSIALAYGIYLIWLGSLPRIRSRVSRRWRRGFDLACMNVALILILAEFSLRIATWYWPMPLLITSQTDASARLQANRVAPGTLRFGFPINADGHFDTPFETTKDKVVISIGDSFANAGVPHQYHFTTVCERELEGVEIYNMGFPAIGPREYLQLLKTEALPLMPDLVVFQIFIGNDLKEAARVEAGTPSWYDPRRYSTATLWQRLSVLRQDDRLDLRTGIRDALPEHDELDAQLPWIKDPLLETPTLSEELFLKIESERAQIVCGPNQHVYHHFFKAVREIEQAAGDVPVAFVLIPDEFQVNDSLWNRIVTKLDPSGGPFQRDRPQAQILNRLQLCGVSVLDLLPALRQAKPLEDGKRHVYHLRDTHFNVRGHQIAGTELADFLTPLLADAPAPEPIVESSTGDMQLDDDRDSGIVKRIIFGQPRCDQSMADGWSLDESTDQSSYVWSEGPKSVLALSLPVEEDLVMEFECQPFSFAGGPRQSIDIHFNGNPIAKMQLDAGRKKYSVAVSKNLLTDDLNVIEFQYAQIHRPIDVLPEARDTRRLAVCWYSLSVIRSADDMRERYEP